MVPRRATLKDVAALAKVSLGTVSNVVNNPDIVTPATRQRVQAAIAQLGWIPNESARQLRAGRSNAIGMLVLDIANPFFTDILATVEESAYAESFSVQVGNSAGDQAREELQLKLFERQRVSGVLYTPTLGISPRAETLPRHGIPVVLVDRESDGSSHCSVSVDDVEGGRIALQHLIDLGHTRIAVVGGPSRLQQVRDRRLGAELAVTHAGGAAELLVISTPSLEPMSGVAVAGELASLPDDERPTAVFAINDLVAIGLLQGLTTQGLRVPDDMAIIGYDDISFAATSAVPLSSVRQPRDKIGHAAAELLFAEIAAVRDNTDHVHRNVRFTPELEVRRSTVGSPRGPRTRVRSGTRTARVS